MHNMKLRFPLLLIVASLMAAFAAGCNENESEKIYNAYEDWYHNNESWLKSEMSRTNDDGTLYYNTIVPQWNTDAYVLIHYFNDRKLTEGNLTPLYTSVVDVCYHVGLYDGTPIDSSYTITSPRPGIYRTSLQDVISGWTIAMEDMRVGDSAVVVIPYEQGYGTDNSIGSIPPYSNLVFHIKLDDIYTYEVNPK